MIDAGIGLFTGLAIALLALAPPFALCLGLGFEGGPPLRRRIPFRICKLAWCAWSLAATGAALLLPFERLTGVVPERIGLIEAILTCCWIAVASGLMLLWMTVWAGAGVALRLLAQLLGAARHEPVLSAVTLATLVCLGRLWMGP